MTLVNAETGEVVELLDSGEAERLSTRIRLRLDTIADNYVAVMPMIREAITREAHKALGYRSPGEYVSDRFGDALAKLNVEVRREVVRELTEAGMSTRAIAPVVGVSKSQVANDREQVSTTGHLTQAPESANMTPADSGQTPQGEADAPSPVTEVPSEAGSASVADPPAPRPAVTGIDGKTYTRPEPKPRTAPRRALPDQFFDAVFDLTKNAERVSRLTEDDRFPQNAETVAAKHRSDLLRAIELLSKALDRLSE